MRTIFAAISALLLMGLFILLPLAGAQIKRPPTTPTPAPKPRAPRPTPTPVPTPNIEGAVWNTIKNSNDPAVFDNFMNTYPNGKFASEARAKRDELRRPKPTPTPAPTPTVAPIPTFEFETIRLNKNGDEVERRKLQARYFVENLGNGVTLEMVEILGGKFNIGSPANEAERAKDEGPQHQVNVNSFWLGKFEVTQAQWQALMENNPSFFKGDSNLPVEQISWNDTQEFLKKLNALPNLKGKSYRLPTEAEWEYAARAGTATAFAFGETITPNVANYWWSNPYENAPKRSPLQKTTSVGYFRIANAYGLFDMHGNVWEWCQDIWHDNYNGAPTDSLAWLSGGDSNYRVLRGGSWDNLGSVIRSAGRLRVASGFMVNSCGFRVACSRTPNS